MRKNVFFCLAILLVLAAAGVCVYHFILPSPPDYRETTEILLRSSGWEPVDPDWAEAPSRMTPEAFSGDWIAAEGTEYNIPGFLDPLSDAYEKIAGNWKSRRTDEVTSYRFMVRDTTGVLPADVHLMCTIAYYRGQIAMTRIYISMDLDPMKEEEYVKRGFQNGWPVTVGRDVLAAAIDDLHEIGIPILSDP